MWGCIESLYLYHIGRRPPKCRDSTGPRPHPQNRTGYPTRRPSVGVGAAPWLIWDLVGHPGRCQGYRAEATSPTTTRPRSPAWVEKVDPWGRCMVIFTAAPPCQDFSRVIGKPLKARAHSISYMNPVGPEPEPP